MLNWYLFICNNEKRDGAKKDYVLFNRCKNAVGSRSILWFFVLLFYYMFIAFDVVQEKRVKGKEKKWSENKASGNCYIIFKRCSRKKLGYILQAFVLLFYVFISVDINEEKKDKGWIKNQKTKYMLLLNRFSVILDRKKRQGGGWKRRLCNNIYLQ